MIARLVIALRRADKYLTAQHKDFWLCHIYINSIFSCAVVRKENSMPTEKSEIKKRAKTIHPWNALNSCVILKNSHKSILRSLVHKGFNAYDFWDISEIKEWHWNNSIWNCAICYNLYTHLRLWEIFCYSSSFFFSESLLIQIIRFTNQRTIGILHRTPQNKPKEDWKMDLWTKKEE